MKARIYTLLSITLICCLLLNTLAFAAPVVTNSSSVQLINKNVVEKLFFIDTDGSAVTMIKTTRPNNTFELITYKNGASSTIQGTGDYQAALSYVNNETFIQVAQTIEIYLGTASTSFYIGPEYKTASDLARLLVGKVKDLRLQIALEIASSIFLLYASPVPLWIKQVTASYEVHGEGGMGFLGYYHMYDSFYTYNHSDTTGPDFISAEYSDREGTTPGI